MTNIFYGDQLLAKKMCETNSKSAASAVNAVTYHINSKLKVLLGFLTTIGFFPGLIIRHEKNQVQQVLQPAEWSALIKYNEDIKSYLKKRRRWQIDIISDVKILPEKCRYCNCAANGKVATEEVTTAEVKFEKTNNGVEVRIINVCNGFKIILAKKQCTGKKMVILEKDGLSITFEKQDMLALLNLNTLISFRLERLKQLKFFQYYNNCLEYISQQKLIRKNEDPIKDILLPALQPQLVENLSLQDEDELKSYYCYFETTEIMHEIVNFYSDIILEHCGYEDKKC